MSIRIEYGNVQLAEADHRAASTLASLSRAIRDQRNAISETRRTFTTEQVCILLDGIVARIQVAATLHRSLARDVNGKGVDFREFVHEVAKMTGSPGPHGNVQLTVDEGCDAHIPPRHALHAGLIIAELLTNASKHAHPTGLPVKVHIHCEARDDGSFMVDVTDDGVGFPENFDPSIDGGLGFQLMRASANGLHAELHFEHDSLGVCARLVKPKHLAS